MSVPFYDSFDHYTNPLEKWTSSTSESGNNFFRVGPGGFVLIAIYCIKTWYG